MKLLLTIFSLLLITVAISGAENPKATTIAPKNDATSKTAPAKDIATAKSIDGKEDEAKNMKKGDLGKDNNKVDPKSKTINKNNSTESEESPSEDAQEDLGVVENQGPTIPAYQIPEQPKDVKKKKRWVGEPNIDFAIDNALGALFGRPQPPPLAPAPGDTVIEEVTYVDEYPPGPVVYKRSKGLPVKNIEENNTTLSEEMDDIAIDNVDTVSLKGDPIAISKPEVKAKAPVMPPKNEQKALPKMEFGNVVTILPAIEEERDFGSSAENYEEMKYQRIAPEVAGLVKKSTSEVVEKEEPKTGGAEEASEGEMTKNIDEKELQKKQMKEKSDSIEKKDEGQKEFVPVYSNEEEKETTDEEAEEKPQKDDPKTSETENEEKSEAQKEDSEVVKAEAVESNDKLDDVKDESNNTVSENDKSGEKESEASMNSEDEESSDNKVEEEIFKEESNDEALESTEKVEKNETEAIPAAKARYREPEKLPMNQKSDVKEAKNKDSEEIPLNNHEPKKDPEEEEDKASEETEDEPKEKSEENSEDEDADIEKDEYSPSDKKVEEDKAKIDAINPVSPEIKSTKDDEKNDTVAKIDEDDKLGPAAYPSEISEDDFSIDHKTGLMPAVSSSKMNDDEKDSDLPVADDDKSDDYNVLEKLQDDVDAASKKEQQNNNNNKSPDYIVVEELKDPIQGHRKYTILKPTYREFHPKENKLIEEVKATLDKSKKIVKRSAAKNFEKSGSEEVEESFESSFSKDTVVDDSNEILKNVADAIERDGFRKPKKDQQPMFTSEEDENPIPLKKVEKPSLNQILGIPESAGPVMIEPEGGIPKGLKQLQSDDDSNQEDYDAPQKVVIQSKQKITLIYDDNDSSEEATKDSSSSESSEEEETPEKKEWIPILDIAVINDQTSSKLSKPVVIETSPDQPPPPPSALPMKHSFDEDTQVHEEQLKKYSNILGNNLVITLSISPPILIIAGVICLTLLFFKVYWILYSPPSQTSSILPKHTTATVTPKTSPTTTNMDFRTPLSIITSDPKKQPI